MIGIPSSLKSAVGLVFLMLLFSSGVIAGVGCGGGESTVSDGSPASRPSAPQPLESGEISLLLAIDNDTREEEMNTRVNVVFIRQEEGGPPWFDAAVESTGLLNGSSAVFSGRLVYTPRRSVLEYGGAKYQLDPDALAVEEGGDAACAAALRRTSPTRLVEGARASTAVEATGDLDVSVFRRVVRYLLQRSACGGQLQALPPATGVAEDVERMLDPHRVKSRVEVSTSEDGTLARLYARAFLHPERSGEDEYDGLLELTLTRIGEVPKIRVPPTEKAVQALRKRVGAAKANELEAGAKGLAGLVRAAVSG